MDDLILHERPEVENPVLVVGLTGWMDGGHVSTATLGYLRERLAATRFAQIDPMDFYVFNFPVSSISVPIYLDSGRTVVTPVNPMEFAAVFRPHCNIEDGVVQNVSYPDNDFWVAPDANLILFTGEEPHLRWGSYCDCIYWVCEELEVTEAYFVGSVASPVPHTRAPRVRVNVSDETLKPRLADVGLEFGAYEGPSSITTSLAFHAVDLGIAWHNLVVEVPHYPFLDMPTYPHSILTVIEALNNLLGLGLDVSDLQEAAAAARSKLDDLMADNEAFRQLVEKLEEAYDYAVSDEDEELLRRLIDSLDIEGGGEGA